MITDKTCFINAEIYVFPYINNGHRC